MNAKLAITYFRGYYSRNKWDFLLALVSKACGPRPSMNSGLRA